MKGKYTYTRIWSIRQLTNIKAVNLIFIFLLLSANITVAQTGTKNENYKILTPEQFKNLESYKSLLHQLSKEHRIDTTDARQIKMLSSNSFVAFEQTPDSIVNERGKITVSDIELMCEVSTDKNDLIILITNYLGFCHAFKYDIAKQKLIGMTNKGSIRLIHGDNFEIKEMKKMMISLIVENDHQEMGRWIRYYSLDLNNNTFSPPEGNIDLRFK